MMPADPMEDRMVALVPRDAWLETLRKNLEKSQENTDYICEHGVEVPPGLDEALADVGVEDPLPTKH